MGPRYSRSRHPLAWHFCSCPCVCARIAVPVCTSMPVAMPWASVCARRQVCAWLQAMLLSISSLAPVGAGRALDVEWGAGSPEQLPGAAQPGSSCLAAVSACQCSGSVPTCRGCRFWQALSSHVHHWTLCLMLCPWPAACLGAAPALSARSGGTLPLLACCLFLLIWGSRAAGDGAASSLGQHLCFPGAVHLGTQLVGG